MKPPRTAALLCLCLALLALAACGGLGNDADTASAGYSFGGTALNEDAPAPDFVLTDQFGDSVRLSEMRGRAVVLSFIFANCPDVCPVVTTQLKRLHDELGEDADSVEFVFVSVDPERDDPRTAMRYLERWGMADEWRYLTGARAELEPIWKAYYIAPVIEDADAARTVAAAPSPSASPQPQPPSGGAMDALRAGIAERYSVIHSAPVYLIDREGTRRAVFTPPLDASEMAGDVRALLGDGVRR